MIEQRRYDCAMPSREVRLAARTALSVQGQPLVDETGLMSGRLLAGALLVVSAALSSGCAGLGEDRSAVAAVPQVVDCFVSDLAEGQDPSDKARARPFLGLSADEARRLAAQEKMIIRVVAEDGHCPDMLTLDSNPDRINLELVRGAVTSAAVF